MQAIQSSDWIEEHVVRFGKQTTAFPVTTSCRFVVTCSHVLQAIALIPSSFEKSTWKEYARATAQVPSLRDYLQTRNGKEWSTRYESIQPTWSSMGLTDSLFLKEQPLLSPFPYHTYSIHCWTEDMKYYGNESAESLFIGRLLEATLDSYQLLKQQQLEGL
jgi:putative component of membrane protein insertase Oxa1/YidC/SpoIIIJ protein YidD